MENPSIGIVVFMHVWSRKYYSQTLDKKCDSQTPKKSLKFAAYFSQHLKYF